MIGDNDPDGWHTETGIEGEVDRIEADANAQTPKGFVATVGRALAALFSGKGAAPTATATDDTAAPDAVTRAIEAGREKAKV